jgi:chromosome segregation ATPase
MPSNSEREAPDDLFRNIEETLKQLRAAATAPPEPESWLKRKIGSTPASPSRQSDFNNALVDALNRLLTGLRETAASQDARIREMATELSELRTVSENLDAFRQRLAGVENESRSIAANVRGLQERAAALEMELAQAREQLSGEQGDLRREMGERIQHLLDEQRVCIRQLSLQASEEAVLADRARRATELKLDELARRVPPPPA